MYSAAKKTWVKGFNNVTLHHVFMACREQGDTSYCSQPPIEIKTKVAFEYEAHVLKCNLCSGADRRLEQHEWSPCSYFDAHVQLNHNDAKEITTLTLSCPSIHHPQHILTQ